MPAPSEIGTIRGVAVGSFGVLIFVTLRDTAGNPQDVSSFVGTKLAIGVSPDKRKTRSASVSFSTDGSDGIVSWAWASGDMDRAGDWELQVVLNRPGGRAKTFLGTMPVIRQLTTD